MIHWAFSCCEHVQRDLKRFLRFWLPTNLKHHSLKAASLFLTHFSIIVLAGQKFGGYLYNEGPENPLVVAKSTMKKLWNLPRSSQPRPTSRIQPKQTSKSRNVKTSSKPQAHQIYLSFWIVFGTLSASRIIS